MGQVTYIYSYTKGTDAYIGKTKNPNSRKTNHKQRFEGWQYAIIDSVNSLNKTEWKPLECYWVEQFRQWGFTLENKNKGGQGQQGFRTDEEIKQLKYQNTKQWNLDNKEKVLEYRKQWNLANKAKKIEYNKQWYLDNREERIEQMKQYNKQYYLRKKCI